MPVFQVLRTFMPVRADDKPKAPAKMQLVARGSSAVMSNPFDEDPDQDSQRESHLSPSGGGPAQSSPAMRTPTVRELTVGAAEGRHQANGHHTSQKWFVLHPTGAQIHLKADKSI